MRMRRKKNLDSRLALCDYIIPLPEVDKNFSKAAENKQYLDFDSFFEKRQPLYLEIGCGKGGFACEFAKRNPHINLLAVERSGNVLVTAAENAQAQNLGNLRFLNCTAEYLPVFIKENSIERIFLNFSCPFPKAKYAAHRLTAPNFLKIYRRILTKNGEIHQKTDNMGLFEFSIESFSKENFELTDICLDLHKSDIKDNIITEYESLFISQNKPIYRLVAKIR